MGYVISFVVLLAQLLSALIVLRAILSWLPVSRESTLSQLLYSATEPVLSPLRNIVPSVGGMDLSPLVAILLLQFIESLFARMV